LSRIIKIIKDLLNISLFKKPVFYGKLNEILVPLIIFAIAVILGYQTINHGLPLKVSLILFAIPVAFTGIYNWDNINNYKKEFRYFRKNTFVFLLLN